MKKLLLIFFFSLVSYVLLAPNLEEKDRCKHLKLHLVRLNELEIENRIKEIENKEFDIKLLIEYLDLIDTLNNVAIRQFILETGWFKSQSFTKYNNIAGMKLPKHRKTTAIGEALGHAEYKHWTDSVQDYILWRDYYTNKGFDTTNYYTFLKEIGYATYEFYEDRLKSIKLEKYVKI